MAEKPKPPLKPPERPTEGKVRNQGQTKDKPTIDKTSVLPPASTKPKK